MNNDSRLWNIFLSNTGKTAHKVLHYFPIYERHFSPYVNRQIVFWEIGVSKGGSILMWKKYFGPFATIVGIDIDASCKAHENAKLGIHVRIGSQSDPQFLSSLLQEFGRPDIILDDGSHRMEDLNTTFDLMYSRVKDNGVYFVEDLCTCYWKEFDGSLGGENTFIQRCKALLDSLNGFNVKDGAGGLPDDFSRQTFSMCAYDSVVVFEKMKRKRGLVTFHTPDDV
jgi:Cephalosporin hydroxylase.